MNNPHSFIEKFIKPTIKFLVQPNYRNRILREKKIKKQQDNLIVKQHFKTTKKIIVFLVPGANAITGIDNISGGVLSIASLFEETKKLESTHQSKCLMCTFPFENLLIQHTRFNNDINVFRFNLLLDYFSNIESLIIHIPEFLVPYFKTNLTVKQFNILKQISNLQINILNQNIRLMPNKIEIDQLYNFTKNITITTAHSKYSTLYYRNLYGVPLHFFSTFASPENYDVVKYNQKENLLLLSPDDDEKNATIIKLIAQKLPHIKVQVIKNLKYQDYKELIKKAKWTITFGEGLDFYFIEPVFSGGVSFAIYNDQFFTPDFQEIETVYSSYNNCLENLVENIVKLDNEIDYNILQQQQHSLCAKYYSKEQYRKNIEAFYLKKYTYA